MSIPFYPELKRLTGLTNAALLMQQHEFYFGLYPDGFYKFLTPCKHTDCRPGDSWTEELECSKKELYGAYAAMRTIRYVSKPEAMAAEAAGQLFGEDGQAWYCTWYDRNEGKVEHRRNHAVVEQALLEAGYPPAIERAASAQKEHAPSDKREHGQASEGEQVTKGNLTKLPKGTCPSDKRELVLKEQISPSDIALRETLRATHARELVQFDGLPPEHAEAIAELMALPSPTRKPIDQITAEQLILRHGLPRIQQELRWLPDRHADNPAALIQHVLKGPAAPPVPRTDRASPGGSRQQRTRAHLIDELAKEKRNCG